VAFGSTRKVNISPEEDPNLRALLAAGTPAVALVGKSWPCTSPRSSAPPGGRTSA